MVLLLLRLLLYFHSYHCTYILPRFFNLTLSLVTFYFFLFHTHCLSLFPAQGSTHATLSLYSNSHRYFVLCPSYSTDFDTFCHCLAQASSPARVPGIYPLPPLRRRTTLSNRAPWLVANRSATSTPQTIFIVSTLMHRINSRLLD